MSDQARIAESGQIAEQSAPGVSDASHSPTPWRFCGEKRGGCSCNTIFEATGSYPVARIVSGPWGDDYAALRIVGESLNQKVEAYSEQITYGEVDPREAIANTAFIVRAVNSHDALVEALEALEELIAAQSADEEAWGYPARKRDTVPRLSKAWKSAQAAVTSVREVRT